MFYGYRESMKAMRAPKHLTLTLVNVPVLTRKFVRTMRGNFKKLMHRKFYREKVRGGLYVIEAVNKGKGWHVHLHVVIDARFLPQRKVSRDWKDLTGSSIVWITKTRERDAALRELLKYVMKRPTVSGREGEYNEALKGTRLVQPFGSIYDSLVLVVVPLKCERCGGQQWIMWEFELGPQFRRFRDRGS
jgi:hypothetical protein